MGGGHEVEQPEEDEEEKEHRGEAEEKEDETRASGIDERLRTCRPVVSQIGCPE